MQVGHQTDYVGKYLRNKNSEYLLLTLEIFFVTNVLVFIQSCFFGQLVEVQRSTVF